MRRFGPLLASVLLGCGAGPVRLPPRASAAAPLDTVAAEFALAADRLDATAAFYERQASRAHTKQRVMSVLAVTGAALAGGAIGPLARADLPPSVRPGLGAAGISMAAFSATFVLLPWAHGYGAREAGYRRHAALARDRSADLLDRCSAATLAGADAAQWAECLRRVRGALDEAWRFPADSPCAAPPGDELDAWVEAGR